MSARRKSGVGSGLLSACLLAVAACGDDGDVTAPPEVRFGETTLVVVVNPVVNDANEVAVPQPGTVRSGVTVSVDGGPSGTTDANGIAVLAPVAPGTRRISLSAPGQSGSVSVNIDDRDLQEAAIALGSSGAALITQVVYRFGGEVVEVTPSTPITQVNDLLERSNIIIFFRGGTYTGDLTFSGSNVTLFGEGERGGRVTLVGNVTVSGSRNRIRGARITGSLSVPGSDAGISFSRVEGAVVVDGSSAVLLNNGLCGVTTIAGSNLTAVGNSGIAPLARPADCPS
ncbi:MAG: hypothetical protein HY702_02345 [Gemmatimonadetes bacterium]|nr:hypothetical protein [Gemmatimonadota bacterium]